MENGKIIIGYPCIGKTTLSNKSLKFIDLDSSFFFIDGKRPDGWEKIYVNIANDLANQGYNVFVSSHFLVFKEILKRGLKVSVVVPDISMKYIIVERATKRYNETQSDKDKRALDRIVNYFEEDVRNLMNTFENSTILFLNFSHPFVSEVV